MAQRYPLPNPWGWFQVGFDQDLAAGAMQSVRIAENDYVLVRDQSGRLALLEAYCPHQGAKFDEPPLPLAGGQLVTCPFHGWQFDLDGQCASIPYAKRIPNGACLRTLPLEVRAGMIFAWHHPAGAPPSYELPDFLEEGPEGWTPWHLTLERDVECHLQEFAEQSADTPHFPAVHGAAEQPIVHFFKTEGHELSASFSIKVAWSNGEHVGHIETRQCGPGQMLIQLSGFVDLWMLHSYTPLDSDRHHLRCLFRLPSEGGENVRRWQHAFTKATLDDIRVFEHKRYREHPLLVDEEACVIEFRRWAAQFYADEPQPHLDISA